MFNLFRRNCLYNTSIEPHCAYCAHCKPENEHQGVCEFRGIVAMAGSCRRFTYDALRRKPPKPARIRGRFTDADFFFDEQQPVAAPAPVVQTEADSETEIEPEAKTESETGIPSEDLSQFADLWEDDEPETQPEQPQTQEENTDEI
jgi:hypothetical protein